MRLLLIDGHYYAYRSFFAIKGLTNSRGEPTNAVYGFIKTVQRMMRDLKPDLGAVIWDQGLPKRRTDLQPEYKMQRAEMPNDMKPQVRLIQEEVVAALGFPSFGVPETEADDLMASYACAARRRRDDVVIATNDKDLFQLVDDRVKIYTTNKTELATPKDTHALLGPEAVRKKWGVSPEQIADVLALVGDSVDNIPGIPGLGPKSAATLIQQHGGIAQMLANLDAVEKGGIREKLRAAQAQIVQNREMVRLDTDLELPIPLDEMRIVPRFPELLALLERCEFKSLLTEYSAEANRVPAVKQGELF